MKRAVLVVIERPLRTGIAELSAVPAAGLTIGPWDVGRTAALQLVRGGAEHVLCISAVEAATVAARCAAAVTAAGGHSRLHLVRRRSDVPRAVADWSRDTAGPALVTTAHMLSSHSWGHASELAAGRSVFLAAEWTNGADPSDPDTLMQLQEGAWLTDTPEVLIDTLLAPGPAPSWPRVQWAGRVLTSDRQVLALICDLLDGRMPYAEPLSDNEVRVSVDPSATVHPTARLVGPVYVGPGAIVRERAQVGPRVVVEPGAEIGPGARLEQVWVLPGARIAATATVTGGVAANDGIWLTTPEGSVLSPPGAGRV